MYVCIIMEINTIIIVVDVFQKKEKKMLSPGQKKIF